MKERFEKFIELIPFTDCWIWNGNRDKNGYGRISVGGTQQQAHRVSYMLYHGDFPTDLYVLHKCDNPSCVNPNHLWLGTTQENTQDKIRKGRQLRGEKIGNSKLSDCVAREIKYSTERNYVLAKKFGVSKGIISNIKTGRTFKHL